jgi:hypothetical protein
MCYRALANHRLPNHDPSNSERKERPTRSHCPCMYLVLTLICPPFPAPPRTSNKDGTTPTPLHEVYKQATKHHYPHALFIATTS